jgi:hypothetical protein
MMLAFRCKTCGRLHEAGHAGENEVPAACRVCGAGARFDPRSAAKVLEPDNWEVLADAPPERLRELGIDAKQVGRHAPAAAGRPVAAPRHAEARAGDGATAGDRAG